MVQVVLNVLLPDFHTFVSLHRGRRKREEREREREMWEAGDKREERGRREEREREQRGRRHCVKEQIRSCSLPNPTVKVYPKFKINVSRVKLGL